MARHRFPWFNKRRPSRINNRLVLGQRNIYVLPSRWGLSFVAVVFLFSLIATQYNNNLGFFLCFLLAALGLISAVQGQRNLAGLVLSPGKVTAVFYGNPLVYPLHLANDTSRTRYALSVITPSGATHPLSHIADHAVAELMLHVTPQQRGWHRFGSLVLESRYPLGLFRVWTRFTFDWQGLVYPAPATDSKPFPWSLGESDAGNGILNDEAELAGFRDYQAGDALKHVHWKSYAKGRGLHTRLYLQGSPKILWLDWYLTGHGTSAAPDHESRRVLAEKLRLLESTRAMAGFPHPDPLPAGEGVKVAATFTVTRESETEAKISRLCRWLLDAEQAGLAYGLRLPGIEIQPHQGSTHRDICLKALALYQHE